VQTLDQTNHPSRVAEGCGRFRLRIGCVNRVLHAQEAGYLVLLRLSLMHPRSTPRRPRKYPSPIDFRYRQGRCAGHLGFQLTPAVALGLVITLVGQFGADLLSQTTDMARTDLQSL
jgi:hypothetical protein